MASPIETRIHQLSLKLANPAEGECEFPAREFEEKSGLRGISTRYVMPEGHTETSIQHALEWRFAPRFALQQMLEVAATVPSLSADALEAETQRAQEQRAACKQALKNARHDPSVSADDAENLAAAYYEASHRRTVLKSLTKLAQESGGELPLMAMKSHLHDAQLKDRHTALQFFHGLVAANPELAALDVNLRDERQVSDVVNGVISHFNLADIASYSIDRVKGTHVDCDSQRIKKIGKRAGANIEWIPAPSTLLKIEQQLDKREQKQAAR